MFTDVLSQGISQCLITAHVALRTSITDSSRRSSTDTTSGYSSNYATSAQRIGAAPRMTFKVPSVADNDSTWEYSAEGRQVEEKGIQSEMVITQVV